MPLNLNQIHQQVNKILPEINRLLIKKFSLPQKISYKPGGIDHLSTSIFTEVDQQVEKLLKKKLLQILPGSGFIGEETPVVVKDHNWIVDPIDGTLNYLNQLPIFACSIALWHHNQPVYSLVSLPMSAETIHAFTGQGIYLNNRPFTPIKKNTKKLFITYSSVSNSQNKSQAFQTILKFTSSPRSYGSSVFHGAQIALGRINAGVFINQGLWDIAAIVLLAQEAGLTIKYISPPPRLKTDDLKNYQHSLVIGEKKLATDLAAKLK